MTDYFVSPPFQTSNLIGGKYRNKSNKISLYFYLYKTFIKCCHKGQLDNYNFPIKPNLNF